MIVYFTFQVSEIRTIFQEDILYIYFLLHAPDGQADSLFCISQNTDHISI